jgi:signal transduction histidine kinase
MKHAPDITINSAHAVLDTVVVDGQEKANENRSRRSIGEELHILMLEDNSTDADLIKRALRDAGIEVSFIVVSTRDEFESELIHRPPNIILSDHSLPGFNGTVALEIAKEKAPHVPFIFVTGVLGEEVVIETLKLGATDYVLKAHLSRLVPAVKRALREAQERWDRERAEEKLRNSHEQLRALNTYLQQVREEERTRIAREVHDELGQALTGLKLDLIWLAGKLPKHARPLLRKIKAMSGQIDSTVQIIRRVATELRPGILDNLGLIAAIEWQATEFQDRTGIICDLKIEVEETMLDPELTTACFRIFQETLTNIIRHAKATRVDVNLSHDRVGDDDTLVLTVRDNGRGIAEKEIVNAMSIGLIGMRERAAQVGGDVLFFGLPGQGTTVTMRLPLLTPLEEKKTRKPDCATSWGEKATRLPLTAMGVAGADKVGRDPTA